MFFFNLFYMYLKFVAFFTLIHLNDWYILLYLFFFLISWCPAALLFNITATLSWIVYSHIDIIIRFGKPFIKLYNFFMRVPVILFTKLDSHTICFAVLTHHKSRIMVITITNRFCHVTIAC